MGITFRAEEVEEIGGRKFVTKIGKVEGVSWFCPYGHPVPLEPAPALLAEVDL